MGKRNSDYYMISPASFFPSLLAYAHEHTNTHIFIIKNKISPLTICFIPAAIAFLCLHLLSLILSVPTSNRLWSPQTTKTLINLSPYLLWPRHCSVFHPNFAHVNSTHQCWSFWRHIFFTWLLQHHFLLVYILSHWYIFSFPFLNSSSSWSLSCGVPQNSDCRHLNSICTPSICWRLPKWYHHPD